MCSCGCAPVCVKEGERERVRCIQNKVLGIEEESEGVISRELVSILYNLVLAREGPLVPLDPKRVYHCSCTPFCLSGIFERNVK